METGKYELWNGKKYQQYNPQATDNTGKYSFLVPPGQYYIVVEAKDFNNYQGEPFEVVEGSGVHQNIELYSKNWILKIFSVERIMLASIIILLGAILSVQFFKNKFVNSKAIK